MTVYAEMLYIKRFREQQAERALVRQRARRVAADRAQQDAEGEFSAFHEYAEAQEASMYSDLCARVVKLRDIEQVQQKISILKASEHRYQELLDAAEQTLKQEIQLLGQCDEAYQHAVRATSKFTELEDAHLSSVHRAFEHKEDQGMEEMAAVLNQRMEWGGAQMESLE